MLVPDLDEYGHPRFGGISGVIASKFLKPASKLAVRFRIYSTPGKCSEYDRRLTSTLADKVVDLPSRRLWKMPVMKDIVPYSELEEYHTTAIEMGNIGNFPLPQDYYNPNEFYFSENISIS